MLSEELRGWDSKPRIKCWFFYMHRCLLGQSPRFWIPQLQCKALIPGMWTGQRTRIKDRSLRSFKKKPVKEQVGIQQVRKRQIYKMPAMASAGIRKVLSQGGGKNSTTEALRPSKKQSCPAAPTVGVCNCTPNTIRFPLWIIFWNSALLVGEFIIL